MAEIEGLDELRAKLQKLPDELGRKGFRSALRKAANVIAAEAKQGARNISDPQTARDIADNVTTRFSKRYEKQTGDLMFRVGVNHGAVKKKDQKDSAKGPTPHWRFFEFGTSKIPARPFLRPAGEAKAGEAFTVFMAEADRAISRAIKRLGK